MRSNETSSLASLNDKIALYEIQKRDRHTKAVLIRLYKKDVSTSHVPYSVTILVYGRSFTI